MRASLTFLAVAALACVGPAPVRGTLQSASFLQGQPATGAIDVGASRQVSGANLRTWSRSKSDGTVTEVGVTLPYAVIENPPAEGDGPAGASAVLAFPALAREQTFFDHFELHWNPMGHEPAAFAVPHFDLHFYGINPEAVRAIAHQDPDPPPPERLPQGFIYPGEAGFVPEMGTHVFDPKELEEPFSFAMVAGIHGGDIVFVEPMVTHAYLLEKRSETVAVPRPASFGRRTVFPDMMRLEWLPDEDAYRIVFSDFVERD
jgi:hypothetical protein